MSFGSHDLWVKQRPGFILFSNITVKIMVDALLESISLYGKNLYQLNYNLSRITMILQ